jgi:hypothetical protein
MNRIGWNSSNKDILFQFKRGLPEWMCNQISTAESQHLLMVKLATIEITPMNVEVLSKLVLEVEENS